MNVFFPQVEVDQYITALKDAGCDIETVQYMRRWKYVNFGFIFILIVKH